MFLLTRILPLNGFFLWEISEKTLFDCFLLWFLLLMTTKMSIFFSCGDNCPWHCLYGNNDPEKHIPYLGQVRKHRDLLFSKLIICLFSSCRQYSISKLNTIWFVLLCTVHESCSICTSQYNAWICIISSFTLSVSKFSSNIMTQMFTFLYIISTKTKRFNNLRTHWTYMPVLNTIYKCM